MKIGDGDRYFCNLNPVHLENCISVFISLFPVPRCLEQILLGDRKANPSDSAKPLKENSRSRTRRGLE